ncbi:uncharacterized protein GGS22DRAFT_154592 [Annulohypoxylon maeteangense]|uniref:uncharacterized protein n=1 Tax=Annulohypoxylon maeteangense TaxID=1927788 RepID=UPI002007C61B|nr:uncharacterized protein GGS22DRAFT_154592 [Annulohypoxylon maeteangense]KAI0887929.1 hypothetical protein GGS22DRAFT_154592 [Annulohypoxylon maeteangense]
MKIFTHTVAFLLATTGVGAMKDFKAVEFEKNDCTGWIKHSSMGLKPQYWQIKMDNDTKSVYTETTNDGIYRWYAFSGTTEMGCDGRVLGRLYRGCASLAKYNETIKCIRWCSLWSHNDHSCKAIGQD